MGCAEGSRGAEERSALLRGSEREGDADEAGLQATFERWWSSASALILLAMPVLVAQVSQGSLLLVSMISAGRMDTESIAATALSMSVINISGVAVVIGLSSALDTLCAQAYGAGEFHLLGAYLQRSIAIGTVVSLLVGTSWFFADYALALLYLPPSVLDKVREVLRISALFVWPLMALESLKRYLQAQARMAAVVVSAVVGTLINIAACVLLTPRMGVRGIAVALVIAYWGMFVVLLAIVLSLGLHKETWQPWSWRTALSGWDMYFSLGLPGLLHVLLEWAAFEVTLFEAARISEQALAVQGVLLNLAALTFLPPWSLSVALGIRVGVQLGAGDAACARRSTACGVALTALTSSMLALVLSKFPHLWAGAYVAEAELQRALCSAANMFSLYLALDALQVACVGALKGAGRQKLAAAGAFCGFWLLMVPLSFVLAFGSARFHGVRGLWAGFVFGEWALAALYFAALFTMDWEHYAVIASVRVNDAKAECELPPELDASESAQHVNCDANEEAGFGSNQI